MWFWDYTPASHSYKKPITKKQLRKMQENFSRADEITKQVREMEEKEKASLGDLDDLISDVL